VCYVFYFVSRRRLKFKFDLNSNYFAFIEKVWTIETHYYSPPRPWAETPSTAQPTSHSPLLVCGPTTDLPAQEKPKVTGLVA
jgi:hypothetical protein